LFSRYDNLKYDNVLCISVHVFTVKSEVGPMWWFETGAGV
jgi:hypothetical protein